MSEFSKILKQLRLESNLSQKQVANMLSIRQQSYARYELGIGEPSINTLIELTKIFNVSADFLLGLKDY